MLEWNNLTVDVSLIDDKETFFMSYKGCYIKSVCKGNVSILQILISSHHIIISCNFNG